MTSKRNPRIDLRIWPGGRQELFAPDFPGSAWPVPAEDDQPEALLRELRAFRRTLEWTPEGPEQRT